MFVKGWSEEEAQAECRENFGRPHNDPDRVQICDDCYRKSVPLFREVGMSPENAQLLESREQMVREVARCFGLPRGVVGDPNLTELWK